MKKPQKQREYREEISAETMEQIRINLRHGDLSKIATAGKVDRQRVSDAINSGMATKKTLAAFLKFLNTKKQLA